MDQSERDAQLAEFWPRLREEAHNLYREVADLRARVRRLEQELASSELANEKLRASETYLRNRIRSVEQSRGWRMISSVRRLRRTLRPASHGEPPEPSGLPAAPVAAPPREPTFAQRWAAEAERRGNVASEVAAWAVRARAAESDAVVVVAGGPDEHTRSFIASCLDRNEPVCELDGELPSGGLYLAIPSGIQPSLVPDLLRIDAGKQRVLVCTAPSHVAVRWFVPAQQDGWTTGLILDKFEGSPSVIYLATHGDAVIVPSDLDAQKLEQLAGVTATVLQHPQPLDVVEARLRSPRSLPRMVLGIE